LLAALLACATPLWAAPAEPQRPPDRVVFGAGLYDIFDRKEETLDLRIEYRWGISLWALRPWAGIEVTADGALYAVAGVLADIGIGSRWIVTPGAGAGFYDEGNGKDLGDPVEFRTQLEFARRFAGDDRLAIALSHVSNAGLGDANPGTEVLTVYYSIPLGRKSAVRARAFPP
jgi:hypothetical protein